VEETVFEALWPYKRKGEKQNRWGGGRPGTREENRGDWTENQGGKTQVKPRGKTQKTERDEQAKNRGRKQKQEERNASKNKEEKPRKIEENQSKNRVRTRAKTKQRTRGSLGPANPRFQDPYHHSICPEQGNSPNHEFLVPVPVVDSGL
jgi:hypothetical protein